MSDHQEPLLETKPKTVEKSLFSIIGELYLTATPVIICLFIEFAAQALLIHFLKSNNSLAIGAAGISEMCINVLVIGLNLCLCCALQYRGKYAFENDDPKKLGQELHKSLFSAMLFTVPGCVLLFFVGPIFNSVGFDYDIYANVQTITQLSIPGCVLFAISINLYSYLNANEELNFPGIAQTLSAIIGVVVGYFVIVSANMGVTGIAIAFDVQQACFLILLIVYIKAKNPIPDSFFWFGKDSMADYREFISFQIRESFGKYFETIFWELIFILVAYLGNAELCGYTILTVTVSIILVPATSLGEIGASYIAEAMSNKDYKRGYKYFKASLVGTYLFAIVGIILVLVLQSPIANFYSTDQTSINNFQNILGYFIPLILFRYGQIILSCCFACVGLMKRGPRVVLVASYLGLILISILVFDNVIQFTGLIIAQTINGLFVLSGISVLYSNINWYKESKKYANSFLQ